VNFFDADGLASKGGAEVALFVPQTDPAAMGDDDGFVAEGIVDGLNQEATPLVIDEAASFFELELKPVVLRGTPFIG
jgi:hypothetical protein